MDWIKTHTDTVIVLGAILSSVLWMNGEFNDVRKDINELKTDMAVMKTVMIIKGMMPNEIAMNSQQKLEEQ